MKDIDAEVYNAVSSSRLMAWLNLVRWKNLVIIAVIQKIAVEFILKTSGTITSWLPDERVLNLVIASTVMIAAAGYIINDYFDVATDLVNRPEKVILSNKVARRYAIQLHITLNLAAFYCAWLAGYEIWKPRLVLMQIGCSLMLWFYSTHLKARFVWGNLVVSLLAAFTVLILLLYVDNFDDYRRAPAFSKQDWPNPLYVLSAYALFAFLLTWMREIVKDMEDLKGDMSDSCETMPIRWGLLKTTRFVQGLGIAILMLLIASVAVLLRHYYFLASAVTAYLMYLLIGWLIALPRDASVAHYTTASSKLKLMMVIGLIIMTAFYVGIDIDLIPHF